MPSERRSVVVLLLALLAAGCAQTTTLAAPVPSEASVLQPDGTVPWVDEPIDRVHAAPPPPPTVAPGSKRCTATQLKGSLEQWWQPKPGAGGAVAAGTARRRQPLGGQLIGEVVVTNVSATDCTLQGLVEARLLAKGAEVPLDYSTSVNQEAQQRVVPVPRGATATLRIDWAGPYCATARPPFELSVRLPGGGGELRAPVRPHEHPACSGDPESPSRPTSSLSAGAFDPPAVTDPQAAVRSPLWPLRAAVQGPATVTAGQRVTYTVSLVNPTKKPVTLHPCPGYLQEIRSSTGGVVTSSSHQLYRLNCRPVDEVPAAGELRFQMVAVVPAEATPGGQVQISWRLQTAQALPSAHLTGNLTIALTG